LSVGADGSSKPNGVYDVMCWSATTAASVTAGRTSCRGRRDETLAHSCMRIYASVVDHRATTENVWRGHGAVQCPLCELVLTIQCKAAREVLLQGGDASQSLRSLRFHHRARCKLLRMNFTLRVLTDIIVPPIADGRVLKVAINGLCFTLRATDGSYAVAHITSVLK